MDNPIFANQDLRQIRDHGLTVEAVERHLNLFKMPPPYMRILRPCSPGDGIEVIAEEEMDSLKEAYGHQAQEGCCLKFVPASGAASRMFRDLLQLDLTKQEILKGPVSRQAEAGEKEAQEILKFMEGIRKFAFFDDLKKAMSARGLSLETLIKEGRFTEAIRLLISKEGLNYAGLPKGLLKFHDYPEGGRTAFEEHLVEAAAYVKDQEGQCALHFTVSEEHRKQFQALLEKVRSHYEQRYQACFHVTFSAQKGSTDTLAVDLRNRPFRQQNGRLLFRPGGHGALIENLNELKGDIIFIKNIDNVVPDRLKGTSNEWKRILGGHLIGIRERVFRYMEKLSSRSEDESLLNRVETFLSQELCLPTPGHVVAAPPERKKAYLLERLNRPIRVCGMVKNSGEPGGGPFWVQDQKGEISIQIVEKAQIDPASKEQQAILAQSTHFNPVDLVCGVRDHQGRPFDLLDFVDSQAVFITRKSKDGRALKALEHPGLWNGSMARWITKFVEVPSVTFNPVKTVNDLLRSAHQRG
jgi:hypothetical protein